ncbi:MAG TPA: alpha/beta hydrolase [Devosia sp.]|jgi:pimeloyl-ACP methyl ester carboxylesterase|nr:alpha/beta hydrolase [Devosia sp.]
MPLLSIVRFLATLLSLLVLGIAAYLLWTWYQGDDVLLADGSLVRVREDWRLWVPLLLLAFAFVGRPLMLLLLAGPDSGEPSKPDRGAGQVVQGANGAQLYVEQLGRSDGAPVILTHGWAMDSTIWHYSKLALAKDFKVIVWDLPGMGKSSGEISLESFARNLAVLVEQQAPQRVVLVGHSIGGMTVQTLARDMPELFASRVAGAVLVNTTYTNPLKTMILSGLAQALRRPVLEPVMRLIIHLQPVAWLGVWMSYLNGTAHMTNRLAFGKYVTRSQLEHTTLLTTRNPPGNMQKGNLAMFHWDATGALAKPEVPLHILAGAVDIVTKPEASQSIAQQSGASLRVIEGCNHMGLLEGHDDYNREIVAFAKQATRPAGLKGGSSVPS